MYKMWKDYSKSMTCHTKNCLNIAKYMILEDRQTHRYCLKCINLIKEREQELKALQPIKASV